MRRRVGSDVRQSIRSRQGVVLRRVHGRHAAQRGALKKDGTLDGTCGRLIGTSPPPSPRRAGASGEFSDESCPEPEARLDFSQVAQLGV
jgi:hypothetical protein